MPSVPEDITAPEAPGVFADEARRAVYDAIALRRDVRHFRPDVEVEADVLARILEAAHLAPSVGFSQPWGFIVVRDREIRGRIRDSFLTCRQAEAVRFPPERREHYLAHKLEGILEAPLNICVAVDLRPRPDAILGTTVQPESVRASACCAVENLWLAARVEGIGVGWVSIVEPAVLRRELGLPAGVEPIAYLCVGHPVAFRQRPMLEETGWEQRRPVASVIHQNRWTEAPPAPTPLPPRVSTHGAVPVFSEEARYRSLAHQELLTKPHGSLGRLEELAAWYAGARGDFPIAAPAKIRLALFAADHGVVVEGVSAYNSSVTAAMVANIMAGGAAINALTSHYRVDLSLIDVGVAGDLSAVPRDPVVPLQRAKVRAGTANIRHEPAMTQDEAREAFGLGARCADDAIDGGADLLAIGELGIGNTTAATALACVFTERPAQELVGRGTGVDDEGLARKLVAVSEAIERHAPSRSDPIAALAAVGGLELAAMAGFILEAARRQRPVVLDGFLGGVAALVAQAIDRGVWQYLLASHLSAERAARVVLDTLGLKPVFDLGLRLGEGTGAVIAADLVRAAVETQLSMATFATAGIVARVGTPVPRKTS